jgi:hypothetical protein
MWHEGIVLTSCRAGLSQICTDGTNCKRRVCFFAHLESEVRKRDDSAQLSAQPDMAAGTVVICGSSVFAASVLPRHGYCSKHCCQALLAAFRAVAEALMCACRCSAAAAGGGAGVPSSHECKRAESWQPGWPEPDEQPGTNSICKRLSGLIAVVPPNTLPTAVEYISCPPCRA